MVSVILDYLTADEPKDTGMLPHLGDEPSGELVEVELASPSEAPGCRYYLPRRALGFTALQSERW
ncbi:MAG TPA: hypothetical protein VMW56_15575 [Candidatus Margulisiibacteriota bacterium]|nr:hypothetical protein [Candidatus Margulisiibacteriota bacterium]